MKLCKSERALVQLLSTQHRHSFFPHTSIHKVVTRFIIPSVHGQQCNNIRDDFGEQIGQMLSRGRNCLVVHLATCETTDCLLVLVNQQMNMCCPFKLLSTFQLTSNFAEIDVDLLKRHE